MSIEKYEKMNQERAINTAIAEKNKIRRVAAYCRVSTESEEQANSLENQKQYFEKLINDNPDWILYGIFSDEGKSGTNTQKRPEFNRMLDCARNGEIDLIVTKEISRFARNLIDCLQYTQELFNLGVEVKFITQGLSTFDHSYTIVFTLLSAFAQEESRTTSERVKFGQKQQMMKGVVFGRSLLGFDVKNGEITVNEEGTEAIKRIFHKYVYENKGTHVIAREMGEEGFAPISKKPWNNITVKRILTNEKYCGDLVQGKTYTPDYLTHKKKYNRGESEFFIVKDHHEPIVSKELFDKANEIMESRALSQEGKAKHSNRYVLSGKIKCGICGSSYVARYKTRKDGSKYKSWRCGEATAHGNPHTDNLGNEVGCYANSIRDEDAMHLLYLTFKSLKVNKKRIKNNLIRAIKNTLADIPENLSINQLRKKLEKETEKRNRLTELYTDGSIDKDEYVKRKTACDKTIRSIEEQIETVNNGNTLQKNQNGLIADIEKAIDELLDGKESEDLVYREILNKIVIVDKNTIEVYLNFIPDKWLYVLSDVTDQPNMEADKEQEDKCNGNISDTDVPISVSNPIPILSGIVNR